MTPQVKKHYSLGLWDGYRTHTEHSCCTAKVTIDHGDVSHNLDDVTSCFMMSSVTQRCLSVLAAKVTIMTVMSAK